MRHVGVLNFRMSEFVLAREKHKVPMEGGGPFGNLVEEEVNLTVADGPTVLVDLDGVIVFWYFPRFIGQGLQVCERHSTKTCWWQTHPSTQEVLVDRVAKLVQVYPPRLDGKAGNRRSKGTSKRISKESSVQEFSGPMTRSRKRGLHTPEAPVKKARLTEATPMDAIDESGTSEDAHDSGSDSDSEDEQETDKGGTETLEPYVDTEGEVAWLGETEPSSVDIAEEIPENTQGDILKVLDKADQLPARYYLSPGWYQTAREKVRNSRHMNPRLIPNRYVSGYPYPRVLTVPRRSQGNLSEADGRFAGGEAVIRLAARLPSRHYPRPARLQHAKAT